MPLAAPHADTHPTHPGVGMNLARVSLALAFATLAPAAAHAADTGPEATNQQAPVHLSWYALGELNVPGLGGFRGALSAYLPGLPLYLAGEVAWSFGVSPSHLAGDRDAYITRLFTSTFTLEARAGVSFERWSLDPEMVDFNYDFNTFGNLTTWKTHTYAVTLPTYQRDTIYAGYRGRTVPGAESCADSGPTPEDCAEQGSGFFLLGYEYLRARDLSFESKEHGTLNVQNNRFYGIHVLLATGDDATRDGVLEHLGAEFFWGYNNGFAGRFSVGWDGHYLLFTAGIGGGSQHSLAGTPPPTSTLR